MASAYIFDLDGTLLDSEILWVGAVERFMRERDPTVTHDEALAIVYGRSWRDVYDDIRRRLPDESMSIEAMGDVLRQYRQSLQGSTDIRIATSIALLRDLSGGAPVCIVSGSCRADVAAGVALMGVGPHLRFFLGAEDYHPGKPDPACYLLASRRLQVEPAECCVFEDSEAGVRAAKSAGMYAVLLARPGRPSPTSAPADLTLSDLSEFTPRNGVPERPPPASALPGGTRRGRRGLSTCLTAAIIGLLLSGCQATINIHAAGVDDSPFLRAFALRVDAAARQVPHVTAAAEAAADRTLLNTNLLISVPYAGQETFAEELLNRAGGLANALPHIERPRDVTDQDVALISVRSWESDAEKVLPLILQHQKKGWMVVLFASRAGLPSDLRVDFLIENGARTGGRDEAPLNAIVNIMNGWLWVCEYASALTRRGFHPGVLMSACVDGSDAHNARFQRGDRRMLGHASQAIQAGELARAYLERVAQLQRDLSTPQTAQEVDAAATLIARQLAAGRPAKLATCLHFLMFEIYKDLKTPFTPFHGYRNAKEAFPKNVAPGDLLVYFAYVGMKTPYEDYGAAVAQTGARLITCFGTDASPANNGPEALAHIEQHWALPDAEVRVPFPPGFMAPVSGIDQGLLFRMLDEAVAAKLTASRPASPRAEER